MNRATCTDIERIRQQIRAGTRWTSPDPLYCEVLTERSEYAVGETPVFDSANNERYFEMSYDVRFPHCGHTPRFDRFAMEVLGVDADNTTNEVTNRYNSVYEVAPLAIGADGFYSVPISLISKEMVGALSHDDPATGVTEFPTFREYMNGDNAVGTGTVFPNLAMLLTVYKDVTSGGVRDKFVAGTTGLLRSPILSPLDANIGLAVSDITLGGVSVAANPLITTFDDYITSPDLFPYIDDARLKPNVGRVLYVVVPPRNGRDLTNPALNYQVEFTWDVPDMQFPYGPAGDARIWVDSLEITQEQIPTIEDWQAAGNAAVNSTPVLTTTYTGGAVPQDPQLHRQDSFTLFALADVPMQSTTVGANNVNVWDLYHVLINYDYVPTGAALTGTRSQDFFISLSGPTGAIVQPNVTSVCLFDANLFGEFYEVAANVRSIAALQSYFPDYEFQVRIVASSGGVHEFGGGICGGTTLDGPGWVDIGSIGPDGIHSIRPKWKINCFDERYNVALEYRVRPRGGTAWEAYELDEIQLRIDQDTNDCDSDDEFDYERECSPWDERYECPPGIQAGAAGIEDENLLDGDDVAVGNFTNDHAGNEILIAGACDQGPCSDNIKILRFNTDADPDRLDSHSNFGSIYYPAGTLIGHKLAVGDVDDDGADDIILFLPYINPETGNPIPTNSMDNFRILDALGNQLYSDMIEDANLLEGSDVAIGNFTNDHNGNEIILAGACDQGPCRNNIRILRFNTDADPDRLEEHSSFGSIYYPASLGGGHKLAVGDVDNDGVDDIALFLPYINPQTSDPIPANSMDNFRILDALGNQLYSDMIEDANLLEGSDVAIGNFTNDHDGNEIILAGSCDQGPCSNNIKVLWLNTDADPDRLEEHSSFGSIYYPASLGGGHRLAVGDVDNDSVDDIILFHPDSTSDISNFRILDALVLLCHISCDENNYSSC